MDQNVPLGSYKDDSVASPVTTTSAALLVKTVGRYNIIKYDGKFYGVPHGVPVDWTTVGRYNIIKYDDKFYGVPLGAPVDWTKDYLTEVPGMIIDASVEKVELAIKNRLTFDSPNAPPPSPAASGMFPLAEELASRGIAFLPRIGAQAIDEILAYFKTRKTCYDSYAAVLTDGTPHRYAELSGSRPFASYALRDVLAAPHLMRFATHPLVLDSVESFLGGPASIYSVNVWWSFPGHAAAKRRG